MYPIIVQRSGGTGNMDDVDGLTVQDEVTDSRVARFGLNEPYCLSWLRVHFGGSGTGTANLLLKADSACGTSWDVTLWSWDDIGVTAAAGDTDVFFRVPKDELEHWLFQAGDELVFEWTNPGTIPWGIEVGLIHATDAIG